MPSFLRYWAKTDRDDPSRWHPVACHCLDVAACAKVFLENNPIATQRLANVLGVSPGAAVRIATFLIALHDIGKLSSAFQTLCPDLAARLRPDAVLTPARGVRHDTIAWMLWIDAASADPDIEHLISGWCDDPLALDPLLRAVAGHHGEPVEEDAALPPLADLMSADDLRAAKDFIFACADITGVSAISGRVTEDAALQASWLLAGLCTVADWIGSNADWFPFASPDDVRDPEVYWQDIALPRARQAVAAAGLAPACTSSGSTLDDLFPQIGSAQATPLQHYAETADLTDEPQLFILEDHAGSGKTEAALVLAHRLNAAGLGDGYYIGLPTMATSNAMYARVADNIERMFTDARAPALVLANSARDLNDRFMASIRQTEPRAYGATVTSGADCTAWLADNRKRSLLAQVGVGTIDQALMAILPKRHQSLRIHGLAQKVVIVDEVHAYDSYMTELLCRLLKFQAVFGASVILLSATLPQILRTRLISAYAGGRGAVPADPGAAAFPLVTRLAGESLTEMPIRPSGRGDRQIDVRFVQSTDDVRQTLISRAQSGHAVCWIRNTVAEAQESYRALLSAGVDPARLHLFHARMALGDRLAVEQRVLDIFGKAATPERRSGQILIATQVVEQSLDVDFDTMVSDLCPVDLLIQRAGRLGRHPRLADGRLAGDGVDRREPPVLTLLSHPAGPGDSGDWHADLSRGTRAVYPDVRQLWLTARSLDSGVLDLRSGPDGGGARRHIEAVYGSAAAHSVPEPIQQASQDALVECQAHAAIAKQVALALESGYSRDGKGWGRDQEATTRLGKPSIDVYLARVTVDGKLVPFADGPHGWAMSRLSLRSSLLHERFWTDDTISPAVEHLEKEYPRLFDHACIMPLREAADDTWCSLLATPRYRFTYGSHYGLEVHRI